MALRLLALALLVAVLTISGATWWSWAVRDAVFLTPDATGVRVVVAKPGMQQISYQAAEGWRAVVGKQLQERGWSASAPVTPAPQHTYYRVTSFWIGHVSETAALGGGVQQAEITVRRGFVWRSWDLVPLYGPA